MLPDPLKFSAFSHLRWDRLCDSQPNTIFSYLFLLDVCTSNPLLLTVHNHALYLCSLGTSRYPNESLSCPLFKKSFQQLPRASAVANREREKGSVTRDIPGPTWPWTAPGTRTSKTRQGSPSGFPSLISKSSAQGWRPKAMTSETRGEKEWEGASFGANLYSNKSSLPSKSYYSINFEYYYLFY